MKHSKYTLVGPFRQLLTLRDLALKGSLKDEQLEIIAEGGILIQGEKITEVGTFEELRKNYNGTELQVSEITDDLVALPGLVDAHTHICFAGSRAMDFAARNGGKSYLEIAHSGGGIWSTVQHSRAASLETLCQLTLSRIERLWQDGITTVEIKSGYGLNVTQELKLLRAIQQAAQNALIDVVPTCLAAHMVPKDFDGAEVAYLAMILEELVPIIQQEKLAKRFDIFIEQSAFSTAAAEGYLKNLKKMGFDLTVHADQFSVGGSKVAVACGALSADHLEVSGDVEIDLLAQSEVIPVALPGASIGLGCGFTPARKLLDRGCSLAIASDWNPGSAPQGQLLTQAAILASFQKLSSAEVLAGITFRAAQALGLSDRGRLASDQVADFIAFPGNDYREILYQQGSLKVQKVWKKGRLLG